MPEKTFHKDLEQEEDVRPRTNGKAAFVSGKKEKKERRAEELRGLSVSDLRVDKSPFYLK